MTLLEERGLPAGLRLACAPAGVAVSWFGGRSGIPARSLVDELLTKAPSDALASPWIGGTDQ